nr:hypothetical protein [Tanacetum cinerariifolium]
MGSGVLAGQWQKKEEKGVPCLGGKHCALHSVLKGRQEWCTMGTFYTIGPWVRQGLTLLVLVGQRKPERQWSVDERKAANLDQQLKILILIVLSDDQINSINCETTKSTWDDLILYHKGLFNVKESRVMDKESAKNSEWVKISMEKFSIESRRANPLVPITESSVSKYDSADESFCTLFPPVEKLDDGEPNSGQKIIKSILKSKSTLKTESLKGYTKNETTTSPAKKNDINGALVKTPMVSPNKLGPDLNGKSVNKIQYRGDIKLHFILTQYQLADIFTKPLDESSFKRVISTLESTHPQQEENAPFEHASQVLFNIKDITFNTNNEVALIYPEHDNKEYFKVVFDFISICYLREAFTRSPTQYKEYLSEFWYSAKTIKNLRIWFLNPKRETQSSLALDSNPSQPPATTHVVAEMHKEVQQAVGGPTYLGVTSEGGANPQLISNLISQTTCNDEGPNKLSLDHISAGTNPYVLVEQTHSTSKGLETDLTQPTTEKGASKIAQATEEEITKSLNLSSSYENQKEIKLEDLSKLVKNVHINFMDMDFRINLVIIINASEEEEDEEVHATKIPDTEDTSDPKLPSPRSIQLQELTNQVLIIQSQKRKLELEKNKAKAKVSLISAQPSFPNVAQLTKLLVKYLTPEFSKILSAHDFSSSLPTELKELSSKLTDLTGEVKDLKKNVYDLEIKLPGDLKEIPEKLEAFTSTIESLSKQVAELKTLIFVRDKMSRDVITVGSAMRIPLLYRGEYSQWRERFMNYLEEQTDGEAMINSIKNDPKFWTAEEKKTRKIDRLARSLLIQELSNDIYSLIDSNETAKDLWDALERQMRGSEYGEQDRKAAILYEYEKLLKESIWKQYGTLMRQTKNLMDINIDALYNILKQNQGDVNDALGYKKKAVVITSDPLALVAEKTNASKQKEKVVVSSDSEGSGADDFSELKKITALLAKSVNKKQEFVKSDDKKEDKKADEKKMDMSKVKCYNCKKEGHFAKDCKKAKEINANMVFMAQIEKVLSESDESSSSAEETIAETVHMIMPSKDTLYNGRKGIGFENPKYFKKAKDLRPTLYDEKVIGLGYTLMFLTHSDEALEIEKFKRSRENKIEFAYDYGNLNASYVNENINFEDDYFQEIINPNFEKIDSPFQQTSSLKPYVPNVILEKIIIDLEDKVVSLLEKEKANLKTIESLKSKGSESSENAIFESKNQSENDCHVVEKECDKVENPKVIVPEMFKLSVSQSVLPILMSKSLCDSKNVKNLDTFSSVRRPKHSGVIWKKKGSSNTSNDDLSSVSHSKLNKDVKRYSRKDLSSCNNSHLGETSSAYVCNDAMNVSCNSRMCDLFDENNFFIFSDESVRISPVKKMPFRKKPCDSMNVHSKSNSNKSLPRTVHMWLPKLQPLAEPVAKWVPRIVQICLWIIDSGCSKHMTGNRALLTNFVEKFLGMVRFGNNDFAVIAGYRDVLQVQHVQTDNGTEFKNKTLAKFFDEVGITQQFFAARMPQQNSVVERRNRTLVEAARTMLTFANLPSFLWAEAITTACFTQNRSIIHKRCWKAQGKRDIEVFVGYPKESAAFRIYNKRTRKIHESMNVNFVEISEMASKQFSLEPGLSNLNETGKSLNPSVSQESEMSKKDLEDLFHNFYDEYFDSSKIMKSSTTNVETSINEEVFYEVSESFQGESSSSSLNDDVQQSPKEVILPQINTQSISNNMIPNIDKASTSHNVFNERLDDAYFDANADWVSAMQEELDQFTRLKVWILVPRPEGKYVIKTKWIFKNKKDESSLVIRNKARLVAVGYS